LSLHEIKLEPLYRMDYFNNASTTILLPYWALNGE